MQNTQHKAFIKLMTANQKLIHKVCNIYCQDKQGKEDLFQDILLQLWRSYPSFKGQCQLSTWIYRVALNTAISAVRKEKRRLPAQSLSAVSFQLADDGSAIVEDEKAEKLQLLHRAIARLNKIEKAIVMLYLDDYSYEEIAEVVGISESNVGVKLHRIKAKLRRWMGAR